MTSPVQRTERALNLIPFITNNPGLSIDEIAARFSAPAKEIFKDLEMLFMCGLPGYSHLELIDIELDDDYVAVRNPQNLDQPRKITSEEGISIILGLQILADLGVVSTESKERIELLQSRISRLTGNAFSEMVNTSNSVAKSPFLAELESALQNRKSVSISYLSARSDAQSIREIFPIKNYFSNGFGYTQAYCVQSQEDRHFKLDRILSCTPIQFSSHSLTSTTKISDESQSGSTQVKIEIPASCLYFLEENKAIASDIVAIEDQLRASISINDSEWLLQALLALPGRTRILAPTVLAENYAKRLQAATDLYRLHR